MMTLEIIRFAAIECEHQGSGELSVYHMLSAWDYAQQSAVEQCNVCGKAKAGLVFAEDHITKCGGDWVNPMPTLDDVLHIGALIEPKWNKNGFRQVDVRVGWDVKLEWPKVSAAMNDLWAGVEGDVYTPDQFFWEYEQIHPWRDGNGRSGTLLANWLNGTLDHPVWQPNYWQDPRRKPGYGAPYVK